MNTRSLGLSALQRIGQFDLKPSVWFFLDDPVIVALLPPFLIEPAVKAAVLCVFTAGMGILSQVVLVIDVFDHQSKPAMLFFALAERIPIHPIRLVKSVLHGG